MLLSFAAITGFLLRSLPWRNFLDGSGNFLFYGPDSYDHLRRITLGLAEFPRIPMFDSYYGYPVGTGLIWSPFFDYFITCLTLIFGGSGKTAHFIGFWLPPLLGGVTVAVVYLATARLFGRLAASVAAVFLVFLPGHILYTFVSELDHHCVEPLLALAVLISVSSLSERATCKDRKFPPWLLASLFFVAAVLLWRGSVIFWGMAVGGVLLQIFALRRINSCDVSHLGRQGAFTCIAAALMLTPLCVLFGGADGSGIKFNIVSWFHVILLLSSAAVIWLLSQKRLPRIPLKVVVSIIAIAILLSAVFGQKFISGIYSGLVVVGRGDPWLDSISELRSMLFPSGSFALMHSLETLSLVYWLFPLLLWGIFRGWRESGDLRAAVFLVWSLSLWILPLFRERYVHLAALSVAMGAGYAARAIYGALSQRMKKSAAFVGASSLLLMLVSPVTPFLLNLKSVMLPRQEITDLPEALRYLRDKTPVTSYFFTPEKAPEYGVMSEWGLGAYVCYLAQRPTVATNFGWETHGLYDSVSFLTTTNPQLAQQLLSKNRVRYLLLSDISTSLPDFRKMAEDKKSPYMAELARAGFKPLATMYYRLYIQDGSAYSIADIDLPALATYRLVYETANGSNDPIVGKVSYYKIFEKVPGALIQGTTKSGAKVALQATLRTPSGRVFTYRDWTEAYQNGTYTFRVPYSTGRNGDVVSLGSCSVLADSKQFRFDISEDDVINGNRVNSR